MTIGKCELEPIKDKDVAPIKEMVGCKILNIGFAPEDIREYQEGGLTFDYLTPDGLKKRLVLCFNECGVWVPWNDEIGKVGKKEIVLLKLIPFLEELCFIEREDLPQDWTIQDNPRTRSYTFLYVGIEIMTLDINDLKIMELGHFFGTLDRDVKEILLSMEEWFDLNAPLEMFDLIHKNENS